MRNYKVTIEKANAYLSFKPRHSVETIVRDLHEKLPEYGDLDSENYYNIKVFKALKEKKDEQE
jgi:hypothetical protein